LALVQGIGIGPALRRARLLRGKTIEEAARETRIRADYLQSLEGERFEVLLGDVYVRGFLRSYATYLGLDPGKVLGVYNRHFGAPRPTLPEASPAPIRSPRSAHPHLPELVKHHPSWAFLVGVTVLLLSVFAVSGLLSSSRAVPDAAAVGAAQSSIPVTHPVVRVTLIAEAQVQATVTADGRVAWTGLLRKSEFRTFEATTSIEVQLSQGGRTRITVNGTSLGNPGSAESPYTGRYTPDSYRRGQSTTAP
jgi:hypothetical protein